MQATFLEMMLEWLLPCFLSEVRALGDLRVLSVIGGSFWRDRRAFPAEKYLNECK